MLVATKGLFIQLSFQDTERNVIMKNHNVTNIKYMLTICINVLSAQKHLHASQMLADM